MTILSLAQIVIAVLIVASVLLQQRGTGLGAAFGGEGGFYSTRRGIAQKLYWATIILAIAFLTLSLLNLVV